MGDQQRWQPRPALAWAVRTAMLVVPVALGAAAGYAVARVLPPPDGRLETAAALGLVAVVTVAVLVGAERIARRFAPLALLLRLGLVFPDAAPRRFRVAIRAVRPTRLARELEAEGDDAAPEVALALLANLMAHDRLTRGHSERVAALTAMVAEELHLDDEERLRLEWGALLHDVGKLEVPGRILRKPGGLDSAEWEVMREHPRHGRELVAPLRPWLGDALCAVDGHHERWDGKGYPDGLSGEEICLTARVVAVTDAYETMTAARSYKPPLDQAEARRELTECAGGQFDPDVVRAFLALSVPRLWKVAGPLAVLVQVPLLGAALRSTVLAPSLHAPAAGFVGAVGQTATAAAVAGGVVVAASVGPGALGSDPADADVSAEVAAPPGEEAAGSGGTDGPSLGADVGWGFMRTGSGATAADEQASEVPPTSGPSSASAAGTAPEGADPAPSGASPGGSSSAPGQSGTAPGLSGSTPGHGGTPPGHGGTPPGHTFTPPGQGGPPPGQGGGSPPGQGGGPPGTPPGHGGTPPGHGGTPPGQG